MSTIAAIFETSADGTLHLPVPAAWHGIPIRVLAELEPVPEIQLKNKDLALKGFGCLKGKIAMKPGFDDALEDFADYSA
jgi:hypothetical protein